jgi:hypothetical protein
MLLPLLRGGGSVCRDGGVFAVIRAKSTRNGSCSAENPSVSPALSLPKVLRNPPSLGKGKSFYVTDLVKSYDVYYTQTEAISTVIHGPAATRKRFPRPLQKNGTFQHGAL